MTRPFIPVAVALHAWALAARTRDLTATEVVLLTAYDEWSSEPVDRMHAWPEGTPVIVQVDHDTHIPGRFVRAVEDEHGSPPWALVEFSSGRRARYRAVNVSPACACGRRPRADGRCPKWWRRCP